MIELLVVLAIVAVLLVVASPNYDSIISGSQVDESRLGLATSLALARTEAIKRGDAITLCAGGNPAGCTSLNWQEGWQVRTPAAELLQIVQRDSDEPLITHSCGPVVRYQSSGLREGTGDCEFVISKNSVSKKLIISPTGRVRMN